MSKYFDDKTALDDVSLSIRKGEFVTILGPSGCGKTTLLRLIAGFQTASEGMILINGREMTRTPPHKRPVNTVFQKYALFPHLNVYDNIAFGLKLKKMPKAEIMRKVQAALKMVGMTDYEYRDVNSLSGGQQQRVAIARAIVNEPEDHVRDILIDVYMALVEKGYNPVNQMVGYIMSEDPTYITSYNNSRSKIVRINRDEIIEELVRSFVEYHQLDQKGKSE